MNWGDGCEGCGAGSWAWLLRLVMMAAFWGGVIWLIVTLVRRSREHPRPVTPSRAAPGAQRPDPEEVLHERFARGEVDVEEYHERVDALRAARRQG